MPRTGGKFTPHCWSNGFGFIVNAHVFADSGFAGEALFEYPVSPPGWIPEGRDLIFTRPFLHENGWYVTPQTARLGFEIDQDVLAKYGHCFFKADRKSTHWMPEVLTDI